MAATVSTFLMFDGTAEDAMNFYVSLFPDAAVESIRYYGPNAAGAEGTVMHAVFLLNGQRFICIDTPVKHEFTFTPAMTIYVVCGSEEEIGELHGALSEEAVTFMPFAAYPFARKFVWLNDKFGVSWQLMLPH